jgi:medium-chain acyl-[acyl-carrier-protein] hydrolase
MGGLISFERARQCYKQLQTCPVYLVVSGHRAPQLPDPHPPIHNLSESEFVIQLRLLDGTPESVPQDHELMELFLPLPRADFALCKSYAYSSDEALDCPISAFGGAEDGRVSRQELSAWRSQTHSSFKLHIFPGKHLFLHTLPERLSCVSYRKTSQKY